MYKSWQAVFVVLVVLLAVFNLRSFPHHSVDSSQHSHAGLEDPNQTNAAGSAAPGLGLQRSITTSGPEGDCHAKRHAEYQGSMASSVWGTENLKDSAAECCAACQSMSGCNVWVFCGEPGGCADDGSGYKQCWLKQQENLNPIEPWGATGEDIKWTSGALYTEDQAQAMLRRREVDARLEAQRILSLRNNESLPLVYFDVELQGQPLGRIEFVLFSDISPRAAENFRALCTGEKGVVPDDGYPGREGIGLPYHFKAQSFYRIIDRFIDQTGAGTDSIFGGMFKDDLGGLALKHDRKGLLSMANNGPDTNTSHFSIVMAPAPHLNGNYEVFGEVVSGFEVAETINRLARGKPNNTVGLEVGARIADSGQIRQGTLVPNLDQ